MWHILTACQTRVVIEMDEVKQQLHILAEAQERVADLLCDAMQSASTPQGQASIQARWDEANRGYQLALQLAGQPPRPLRRLPTNGAHQVLDQRYRGVMASSGEDVANTQHPAQTVIANAEMDNVISTSAQDTHGQAVRTAARQLRLVLTVGHWVLGLGISIVSLVISVTMPRISPACLGFFLLSCTWARLRITGRMRDAQFVAGYGYLAVEAIALCGCCFRSADTLKEILMCPSWLESKLPPAIIFAWLIAGITPVSPLRHKRARFAVLALSIQTTRIVVAWARTGDPTWLRRILPYTVIPFASGSLMRELLSRKINLTNIAELLESCQLQCQPHQEAAQPNQLDRRITANPLPAQHHAGKGMQLTSRQRSTCAICLERPLTHAFVPCGHRCVCTECGDSWFHMHSRSCPVCRAPSTGCMRVFDTI